MIHYFLVVGVFVLLVLVLIVSLELGRNLGKKHLIKQNQQKLEVVSVAESAVFGLLALLIAFTFSGAYDRFESRKMHIVEEANIFDMSYNYIDLIPENLQPELRNDMRKYFEAYIRAFDDIPYMSKVNEDLKQAQIYEDKIWNTTVQASKESANKALAQIYIPTFNDMFETAHMGYYITQIHPPAIIFALLIGLAMLGGFLVGYNSAENKQRRPLHSVCYVLLTAITIYVIINMEFPRVGFIDLGTFDRILLEVRGNMV